MARIIHQYIRYSFSDEHFGIIDFFLGSLTGLMNAIGSITPIVSTPIAGAVLQNDVSANFYRYNNFHLLSQWKFSPSEYVLNQNTK
jgi:hypothetical protein